MAPVPQDSVQLMVRHINVGVCVCWVVKLSLESRQCNQWSQRERLSDQPLHVYSKVSCFVRALLARPQVAYKRTTYTFTLVPLSESDLAQSDGHFIWKFMVTLSVNKQTGQVLFLPRDLAKQWGTSAAG